MRSIAFLFAALLLASCDKPASVEDDLHTSDLTLPGGQVIRIEMKLDARDMLQGLMFRPSLAEDHGMLFVHKSPGQYSTWTYQHLFPLDMIWIDENRKIVENAPPCKTVATQCTHYGGQQMSQYMLELTGGMVKKYKLQTGQYLNW